MKRAFLALLVASTFSFAQDAAHKPPVKADEHVVEPENKATVKEVENAPVNERNEIMWKWVNFTILAAGLGYLAVTKGGPFFRNRAIDIQKGIQEAAAVKAEAETRAQAIEKKIAALGEEVEALRRESQSEMQAEGERIRTETAAEITKLQARAEQEIASAAKLATQDLKAYSAELALNLAEQQIRGRMDQATEDGLVRSFLREIDGDSKAAVK